MSFLRATVFFLILLIECKISKKYPRNQQNAYITIRGSTVSEAKRKAKKKKKVEKYGQKCDFVGSNRRSPGPNQTPRGVL